MYTCTRYMYDMRMRAAMHIYSKVLCVCTLYDGCICSNVSFPECPA